MPGGNFNQAIPLKIDGEDGIYLVGQMVSDVPFLARSNSGVLSLPSFVKTNDGLSMMDGKEAVVLVDGHIANVEIPPPPARLDIRNLQIPSLAVNEESGAVRFFGLSATGYNAERFLYAHKGDTLVILGKIRKLTVPNTNIVKPTIVVSNVTIVRLSKKNSV